MDEHPATFTAFAGDRIIAAGEAPAMLTRLKRHLDRGETGPVLIFQDQTGAQVDFDLRGTAEEAVARLPTHPLFASPVPARTGPGRPKLGVVSREVTLLPRHWEWLEAQPHGLSATLRRLVEEARKREPDGESGRRAREAASRFMTAMAGDRPGYEEASRALFAGDGERLQELTRPWPPDIRKHLWRLARGE